jgi:hypothetical protein
MEAETKMNLKTIAMTAVAALTLVAGRADAQDAGWDTKYGILFTLPNPFGGGSGTNVINDYEGRIGAQYNLGAQTALRLSVRLSRTSASEVETTNSITDTKTVTVPDPTSTLGIGLGGEYVLRLSPAAVSPYVAAGVFVSYDSNARNGTAQTTVAGVGGPKTDYDNKSRTLGFGINGKLGLEWRVHKVLALFAEYQLEIPIYASTKSENSTKVDGTATVDNESTSSSFLEIGTGVAQGGQLGLIAFF